MKELVKPPDQGEASPAERFALALLALNGAVFLPDALNRFVFPKLFLIAVAVAVAAALPARGRLPRGAVIALCAGAAVLLVATLNGEDPLQQLLGREPRYEGGFVLALYAGAGVSGARLLGAGRPGASVVWFARCLALAAILIGVEAILETAGLRPLAANVARPGSLLGNASDEGAWGVLALGPLLAITLHQVSSATMRGASVGATMRGASVGATMPGVSAGTTPLGANSLDPLIASGGLAAAATVVCSASRGALLGALSVLAVLAVLELRGAGATARHAITSRRLLALGAGVVLMLGASFALPATRARLTASGGDAAHSATGHRLLWQESLHLIGDHPLLGVGPSGYLDAIPKYHSARYEREIGPQNPPDGPHDWLLQAAGAGGIPLLAITLLLGAMVLRRGLRAARDDRAFATGLLAALCGYAVALLFFFTTPGSTPLAACFAGALLACAPSDPAVSPRPGRYGPLVREAVVVVFAALAVLMAAAAAAEIPLRSAIDDLASSAHFAAANGEFREAQTLRPWDRSIAQTAAHAYAVLAADGIDEAITPGLHWSAEALRAFPDNVQSLSDAATLRLAQGDRAAAARLIARALRQEPQNPVLRRTAAGLGI